VPRIRVHDLRHSCATIMLELGITPKVVSEQLGHTTVSVAPDRSEDAELCPNRSAWRNRDVAHTSGTSTQFRGRALAHGRTLHRK